MKFIFIGRLSLISFIFLSAGLGATSAQAVFGDSGRSGEASPPIYGNYEDRYEDYDGFTYPVQGDHRDLGPDEVFDEFPVNSEGRYDEWDQNKGGAYREYDDTDVEVDDNNDENLQKCVSEKKYRKGKKTRKKKRSKAKKAKYRKSKSKRASSKCPSVVSSNENN